MSLLNIYLSTFAYYVQLDKESYESENNKSSYKKWAEDRKGKVIFNFLSFENLSDFKSSGFPKSVTKIGVRRISYLTDNPLNLSGSADQNILIPVSIEIKSSGCFCLLFDKKETSKTFIDNRYITTDEKHWITKIIFRIDDSKCNLEEEIEFSDGSDSSNHYHLISKWPDLRTPEYYSLFNFEK